MSKQNIERIIEEVEARWLQELYQYVKDLFHEHPLPSHDHTHHFRVWEFSKEIVRHLSFEGFQFTREEVTGLIIAVFFHDAGMIRTLDERHGQAGMEMCMEYFRVRPPLPKELFQIVLLAILKHDDKDYKNKWILPGSTDQKSLTHILSISDDLDALGYTGIYRYLEIYHLRRIPLNEIPFRAYHNLSRRYKYFMYTMSNLPGLISRHQDRFEVCSRFFEKWKKALEEDGPYVEIADRIIKELVNWKQDLDHLITLATAENDDTTKQFYKDYAKETALYYEAMEEHQLSF